MTHWALVAVAALITYLSRAAALAFLPPARGRLLNFVERVPAPLFAGLAVFTLAGSDGRIQPGPELWAAAAGLAASRFRSLTLVLAAGLLAYGLAAMRL